MKRFRKIIALLVILIIAISAVLYLKAQYVVPIVMYHNIDGKSAASRLSVSPESFKRQMNFLKNQHYNVVKLEDLAKMIRENQFLRPEGQNLFASHQGEIDTERPLFIRILKSVVLWPRMYRFPSKTIAITFDDGYRNNYTDAYPVLKNLDLHASIFIIPALVGTDGYLTWDQIIEMSESGVITIGSHTMTHPWLPAQPAEKMDLEIRDSKLAIENHLNKEVSSFSYPLGGFNKDVREKVIKAGYKIAVATNPGKIYPKHDLFAMKRLRISNTSDNLFVFWFEITGFYTWIKEHRDKD